jgi:glucosamine--fructose-6-phosphate aminotransferase (isomerizing)
MTPAPTPVGSAGSASPGAHMAAEIDEQPEVWERILADAASPEGQVASVAARIRSFTPHTVLLVARGTSDHAALYAKYLIEITHGLPCGLVSPSTMTAYRARPDLHGVLMIGVSQSGGSPDLVQSLEVGGEQGALTVAVTNDVTSPLARAAEAHVDILAGRELSVAATKSYTAQQLSLYLLLDRMSGGDGQAAQGLPEQGRSVLSQGEHVAELAQRYRFASRMVTTARGYSYPTAREAALKLMETCYVSAQAFSGADLLHGPLAMIDAQLPVFTVLARGVGGDAMSPVLPRLQERGADVFCVGTAEAVARASVGVALPEGTDERLSPLLEILPFQQLAHRLALARGGDPDTPRGLKKVTETL